MSECPYKFLKKQMVGDQVWYACECGQKFRVEPWDGRVRVVEGLKVEEGVDSRPLEEVLQLHVTSSESMRETYRRTANSDMENFQEGFTDGLKRAIEVYGNWQLVAAQHLKREQKSDCPRCGSDSRSIEITCVHCGYLFAAAQPPQDIVLRALGDWAYQYPDTHLSKEHAKALELVSIYAAEERNPDERTKDTSKFSSGGE